MMTRNYNNRRPGCLGSRGFSLIELLVVIAILGILAAAVGVYINTADANLKSFAFNLGSRFKLAKFEAMKRGHNVYMDFDMDKDGDPRNDNGYTMWVDNNDDGVYEPWNPAADVAHGAVPANGVCDADELSLTLGFLSDCEIGAKVVFPNQANVLVNEPGPELYDASPGGGPAAGPAGAPSGGVIGAGVTPVRFRFQPSGDSSSGVLYIYFPRKEAGGKVVAAGPWAIVVQVGGRIQLDEWKSGLQRPGHSGWVSEEQPI
jgi:prepilin-type N-terminal cleavage/methylation domain-containing protein